MVGPHSAMARLTLSLLGGFQARLEPGGALSLPTRKTQALLAYLALPVGRAHPRDKLAALLWGGIREESARASLRQALFAIRRALGEAAIRQDGDALALESAEVDAAAFEHAVGEGTPEALARAAGLYRGELLDGLALDEAPFEEWVLGERERLRELALEALARLLAHQRKTGATEAAVQTALRLLALDPLQEAVHRALMRLYAESNRRGSALRQYQQCVNALHRELGIEPEAETKVLYQEILRQRVSRVIPESAAPVRVPGHVPVSAVPLTGRTAELERLRDELEAAWSGRGSVIALLGEAGIGKTRLVGELLVVAEARGGRVLIGRSYESQQVLPFGPWVDALRAARVADDLRELPAAQRAELGHLVLELAGPGVEPSAAGPDFLKVFESVTAAIGLLAARQPLLVALEDLHWSDEMSLRLLAFLGRRLESQRVLVVVTARAEELADAAVLRRVLDELAHEARLASVHLAPLSRAETFALVRWLSRIGIDEAALAVLSEETWAVSAGNPFVVVETMRSRAQGVGVGGTAAGSPGPPGLAVPEPVRQLVTRRLERLSDRGRLLTTLAAVIGREFEFALLWRAAGLGEAEVAEGVEELVRRGVLQGVGERFDVTHDRIREVARADALAPRRRVLHRQVAEAIEALHAADLEPHIAALGLHYHEAGAWPQAIDYLRRAADHAFTRSAYREAAACLERAVAAAGQLPDGRATLEMRLDLQLRLRTSLWPLAEFDRIGQILRDAERLATSIGDASGLGRIAAYMSVLRWVMGDFAQARALAQRAAERATALGDPLLRAMAVFWLGLTHLLLGDYHAAEAALLENARMLADSAEPYVLGSPRSMIVLSAAWVGVSLAERGEFADGLAHVERALASAEAAEDEYGIVTAGYGLGYLRCQQGQPAPAIPDLERALAICRERDFSVWLPQITGMLGHARVLTGRIEEGLALLEQASAVYARTRGWPFRTLFAVHRGSACLGAERPKEAQALAEEALTLAREHGERGHQAWALRLLGDIAARRDRRRAERYYMEARALAAKLGMRPLLARCDDEIPRQRREVGASDRAKSDTLDA